MYDYKIIQIIPSVPGMKSKYKDNEDFFTCNIVCFALVEYADGQRMVMPMDITEGDGCVSIVNTDSKDFVEIISE